MKEGDVPQDDNVNLSGNRKAVYAVGENGRYTVVPSSGWKVEETVTSMAIAAFEEATAEARKRVESGQSSPLEYYMYCSRLDLPTLAQEVGMMRWRVRRHLKPKAFAKLGEKTLQRYAAVLDVSPDALKSLPDA